MHSVRHLLGTAIVVFACLWAPSAPAQEPELPEPDGPAPPGLDPSTHPLPSDDPADLPQLPPPPPPPPGARAWRPQPPTAPPPAAYPPPSYGYRPDVAIPAPQSEGGNWAQRPLAIEGVVAFTSPVGHLGAAIDYAVKPWFVINAGLGVGGAGMQVAVTPRVRLPLGDVVGLGIETGLSGGPYDDFCFGCEPGDDRKYDFAVWWNVGGVLDLRTGRGFHFRLFFGSESLVNEDSCKANTCRGVNDTLPYFGITFGGALSK